MNQKDEYGRQIKITHFEPIARSNKTRHLNLQPGKIAVYLILILSLVSVWYILTARSVSILAFPDVATVNVKNWPSIKIGNRWLLRPGNREIEVKSLGYYSFQGKIEVTEDHLQTHKLSLIPLPGKLDISLRPINKASLYIDGEPLGIVPSLLESVPAGQREIEIKAPRYQPFKVNFFVEGQRKTQKLDVRLEPAWASFEINSKPSEATVLIGEKIIGTTPLKVDILEGEKKLSLEKSGYKNWAKKIKIKPNQPIDMGTISLSKNDGFLKLTSIPEKVTILLNNDFKGQTPLTLRVSPDKNHVLKFQKKGYRLLEREIVVESDASEGFLAELIPELAQVYFSTTPKDAELLVNGESRGLATQLLQLPTFEHEVTIRRKGYATYQTKITPRKNFEKRLRIRLKTIEEATRENNSSKDIAKKGSPDTTFTGQKMKLFENIETTLGSENKESEGRQNEPLRKVFLKRPFYLSKTEVTNSDYKQFIASHISGEFDNLSLNNDEQPVSNVSWINSVLFCNWLSRKAGIKPFYVVKYGELLGFRPSSTGYRLPTEAEWEWAQKPTNARRSKFSWGMKYPPPNQTANFADESTIENKEKIKDYNDGFPVAAPVASFPSNSNGLFDMDGNVAEWVNDFYDGTPELRPEQDPLGPVGGRAHVIKGSSWRRSSIVELRGSYRFSGEDAAPDIGFRVARYAR